MRRSIARWLQGRLKTPNNKPPSGELGVRVSEITGTNHVLLSHGDALEFISGNDREGYTAFTLTPRAALKLAWWVLWRWWARSLLFGWKLSAWQWTVEVELEERKLEKSAELQRRKQLRIGG